MGWVRPNEVDFPVVWLKFDAKDIETDNLVEYRVQDLPLDRIEDAIEYLLENYLDDEPFTSSKDFREDPEALEDVILFWRNHFACKSTLVCFRENSDEIVGINLNAISLECDKDKKFITKAKRLQDLIQTVNHISAQCDIFEKYNVDAYLTAFGLSVSRKYRERGIATQILKARIPFCQKFGIKISSTVFSSVGAQKAAAKVGFKEIYSTTREELAEVNPIFYLKNLKARCLLMVLEIPTE